MLDLIQYSNWQHLKTQFAGPPAEHQAAIETDNYNH